MQRETYQEEMKAKLREWDGKIDALKEKARGAAKDSKARYDAEIKELVARREAVSKKFGEMMDATDDAWDDIRGGFEEAWKDMKRAGDVVLSAFRK